LTRSLGLFFPWRNRWHFRYYGEGYKEGLEDGEEAGLAEGRLFGLEKGFDKFVELGRIQGRVSVWKARILSSLPHTQPPQPHAAPLPRQLIQTPITNSRLMKQIYHLEKIVSSPQTANDVHSVEEVQENMRRAKAKMKVICRLVGEKEPTGSGNLLLEGNIEDGNFHRNVR